MQTIQSPALIKKYPLLLSFITSCFYICPSPFLERGWGEAIKKAAIPPGIRRNYGFIPNCGHHLNSNFQIYLLNPKSTNTMLLLLYYSTNIPLYHYTASLPEQLLTLLLTLIFIFSLQLQKFLPFPAVVL